ncbi:hypothetical protein D3C81_1685350 [compost metagenome]
MAGGPQTNHFLQAKQPADNHCTVRIGTGLHPQQPVTSGLRPMFARVVAKRSGKQISLRDEGAICLQFSRKYGMLLSRTHIHTSLKIPMMQPSFILQFPTNLIGLCDYKTIIELLIVKTGTSVHILYA